MVVVVVLYTLTNKRSDKNVLGGFKTQFLHISSKILPFNGKIYQFNYSIASFLMEINM